MPSYDFDCVIVGAGPAGSILALALQNSGLRVLMLDRAVFPRDKACGDAIPMRAVRAIREMGPEINVALDKLMVKQRMLHARAVAPNGMEYQTSFVTEGYTIPRFDFDNWLLGLVDQYTSTRIRTATPVTQLRRVRDGIQVFIKGRNRPLLVKLIVGADGASSLVARSLGHWKQEERHHSSAIRAYFANVKGLQNDRLEFFFDKDFLPGYFWLFPLADGRCNAGFGMLSREIRKRKINLRQNMLQLIESVPEIRDRFSDARPCGKPLGAGLPLGSKKRPISGERFLLLGDAAGLVDPATGEGIGNAALSAQCAAQVIVKNMATGNFSAAALSTYDQMVYEKIWRDMSLKYWGQRLVANRQWLLNGLFYVANNSKWADQIAKKVL